MTEKLNELFVDEVTWTSIKHDGLDIEYSTPIPRIIASAIMKELEQTLQYFTGDLAKIKIFGKTHPLPRQHIAYGDPGITYKFSNLNVPALPWPTEILSLRNFIYKLKGIKYNFVLVNKYRNGNDYMGEHRDNEPELDPHVPIASLSFGEERIFVLKHTNARKARPNTKQIPPISIKLEHGSLLFMNPPTNEFWYHSLPKRKKILGSRINLTFRKIC